MRLYSPSLSAVQWLLISLYTGADMFFIFDCHNNIVGNSKGYKTYKGALTQCNIDKRCHTKIMCILMNSFYKQEKIDQTKTRIFSIRWVDKA